MISYLIQSDDGYWSNQEGWMEEKKDATVFSEKEKEAFSDSLPLGKNVKWVVNK